MLDGYILFSLGLLLLATLLHAGVGWMFKDCDTLSGDCQFHAGGVLWMEGAYHMDRVLLALYLSCYAVGQLVWWWLVQRALVRFSPASILARLHAADLGLKEACLVRAGEGSNPTAFTLSAPELSAPKRQRQMHGSWGAQLVQVTGGQGQGQAGGSAMTTSNPSEKV